MAAETTTRPCWDVECENLHQAFLKVPLGGNQSRAAFDLLTQIDKKHRERWSEAKITIHFTHSSWMA